MSVQNVQRRMARLLDVDQEALSVTHHETGVSIDSNYDMFDASSMDASLMYHESKDVFSEMRVRLPEVRNNTESGVEAKEVQRFLKDDLGRFIDRARRLDAAGEAWPRVEIASTGFVLHVEVREMRREVGLQLLKKLKRQYEPPRLDEL